MKHALAIVIVVVVVAAALLVFVGPAVTQPKSSLQITASIVEQQMSVLVRDVRAEGVPAEDLSAQIDWGDGTRSISYSGLGAMSHSYSASGTYTVSIDVRAPDGRTGQTSKTVTLPAA